MTAACTDTTAPGRSAAPASPSVDLSAELRARAGQLLDQGAIGAVVRVDDGHRVVQFAVGLADLKPRRKLEPGDEFRVGSTTKTFISALVLQLVAEGRLALDDTVDRWLPGQLPTSSAVTVRMLLNHSSGLPDYTHDPC